MVKEYDFFVTEYVEEFWVDLESTTFDIKRMFHCFKFITKFVWVKLAGVSIRRMHHLVQLNKDLNNVRIPIVNI